VTQGVRSDSPVQKVGVNRTGNVPTSMHLGRK
jgi:hypothetical protein